MHPFIRNCFLLLICCWVFTEIVIYKNKVKEMTSLSRHFIHHQHHFTKNQMKRYYGMCLNLIFSIIIIMMIIFHHHTIDDAIMIGLLLYLFYDMTCCYDPFSSITEQLTQRHHYPIAYIFTVFLFYWMYRRGFIPRIYISIIIIIVGIITLYLLATSKPKVEDRIDDWWGLMEFLLFFLFVLVHFEHFHVRKHSAVVQTRE